MEHVGASNRALLVLVLTSGALVVHARSRPHVTVNEVVRNGDHLQVQGSLVPSRLLERNDYDWGTFVRSDGSEVVVPGILRLDLLDGETPIAKYQGYSNPRCESSDMLIE